MAQEKPPGQLPPGVAERIVVPVANPATAEGLLRLALSLVTEDGRVIAVYVTVSSEEPRLDALEALQAIVDSLAEAGKPVELVTEVAISIARGILDQAQERNADLLALGVRGLQRGKVILGPVADAVARTAPCDVLIYRGIQPLYGGEGYTRVVVPVDGSNNSRLAARIGLRFASHVHTPMAAIYVQTDPGTRRWQALGHIEASLEGLEGAEGVRKLVVRAADVGTGILSRCDAEDLILLGFSEQSPLDSWLFGDIAQRMLSEAPGPLILVKQAAGESVPQQLEHRLSNLMPTLTPAEEVEVVQMAQEMARPSTNYFVLVILSCLIASLGLLMNSAAVIIGAMLIAPLMSPLMGFAVGLTQGHWRLMRTAVLTTGRGMLLTLALAALVGWLTPFKTPTAEMVARGQPSLPDMGVALFSGMAGAYAMARKDIPSALAGVAIAAALMPPLCTVGVALAFGQMNLAGGAFLLYITNIVSISLAGAGVFLWLGVRLRADADEMAHYRRRILAALVVLAILALPLSGSLLRSLQATRDLEAVREVLQEQLAGPILDVQWSDRTARSVVATVRLAEAPTPAEVAALERQVRDRLGDDVQLELEIRQSVRAPEP